MTDQDQSYRPRSPDFSTFQSVPLSPTFHNHNLNHNTHYQLPHHSPVYQFGNPFVHRASYDASPFFTPQYQPPPLPQQPSLPHHPVPQTRVPQQSSSYFPPDPDMARRSSRIAQAAEVAPHPPVSKYVDPVEEEEEYEEPPKPAPVPVNVEVKTKFPVARIKRIMQADEDVGKVAQVTPIAVSKALELFMISLVTKAAREAKDRNSKRVTASHLKQAVVKDEVLDFLADIIAKVPDQPASRKHDDDNSDQNEQQPKRKRGGRRPKEESD
ncbi:histone-fold-containing protein [Aspergillus eucalypticola CBS 122712]|uniref:NCT transcriptional regulatory complex subunit A n=1 Tax=Aspergillus eucalypticola (strain CBS 122712 / IBT 29274) TaxID=1448314 RepID=A0A317ULS1_ASPEC|nr:histone-fold-containing protein [Aspergillus eucalypticola CBS 122712]PWY62158.1 histone-fold-containing protein [Aspergillus eucalypticola CBS 122712]